MRRTYFLFLAVICIAFFVSIIGANPGIPCANSISCQQSLQFQVNNDSKGIFENKIINVPPINVNPPNYPVNVQGIATASGEKHIYVDLSRQILTAYEGSTLFMQTSISSGKWHDTPTGEFSIWHKVRATRMSGGSGNDYYDLPNVPNVMFFYNNEVPKTLGFGFHGAYWHDNFGHPMSHGCINMRQIDAAALYQWADPASTSNSINATDDNPGTKVTIYQSSQSK